MGFIAGKIAHLLHYRCLVLYLHDQEHKVLSARSVHGLDSPRLARHTLPLGAKMSGWAALHLMPIHGVAHKDPVLREGGRSDLEELTSEKGLENLESSIVAPLLDGDALLGVLALYDVREQPYEDDNLRVIPIGAGPAAVGLPGGFAEGGTFSSLTVGLNYKPFENVRIRPELRWDWTDFNLGPLSAFDDASDNNQFTAAFDVILSF
mgnify:CR=1 FL=1